MQRLTRLRLSAVRGFARLCNVPIIIDVAQMKEFKLAEVAEYIGACEQLFGPIFDPEKLPEFRIWAWDFLSHPRVLDSPFNMHVHPLETTAVFFQICYDPLSEEQSQAMEELYARYRASGLKLSRYD